MNKDKIITHSMCFWNCVYFCSFEEKEEYKWNFDAIDNKRAFFIFFHLIKRDLYSKNLIKMKRINLELYFSKL